MSQCSHPRCRKDGAVWIGENSSGEDGWVCETHIQFCSITDDGAWRLWHTLGEARKAQAKESWVR